MKLVLDKPVTVAQGLTLEEADWGPWQFPQLLKREDGVLFASINLGPDNWESYGDTLWYKSSDNGRTWTDSNPSEAATAYPKAKNGDGFMAKDRGYVDIDPKLLEGIEPKHVLNFDDKPFFDYYLYSDLRPGTIDTSVMFMRLKKGETEQEGFCPKVTDNPGLCIVRPSGTDKLLPNKMFGRLRVAPDGSLWQMHYDRGFFDGKFCDTFIAYYSLGRQRRNMVPRFQARSPHESRRVLLLRAGYRMDRRQSCRYLPPCKRAVHGSVRRRRIYMVNSEKDCGLRRRSRAVRSQMRRDSHDLRQTGIPRPSVL